MGWRFRKSIRVGKGFRVNLGRSGVGWSAGIPGTGFSFGASPRRRKGKGCGGGCLGTVLILAAIAAFLAGVTGDKHGTPSAPPGPVAGPSPDVAATHPRGVTRIEAKPGDPVVLDARGEVMYVREYSDAKGWVVRPRRPDEK